MKTNILIIFIAIGFSFLSCEKLDDIQKTEDNARKYEVPIFASNQTEFTDNELLNATYSKYKYPLNFYSENIGDTTLYYVNTVSIDSLNENWIELSTNSFEQAKDWCIKSTYENSRFVLGQDSEKFFEFIRIDNPIDNSLIKFRVHKKSYLKKYDYNYAYYFFDLPSKTDTIGIFEKQNFTSSDAKELIDYLWFIRSYNSGSNKILSSYFENTQQTIEVYHNELLINSGDTGVPDIIKLITMVYEIYRSSGIIEVRDIKVREIAN